MVTDLVSGSVVAIGQRTRLLTDAGWVDAGPPPTSNLGLVVIEETGTSLRRLDTVERLQVDRAARTAVWTVEVAAASPDLSGAQAGALAVAAPPTSPPTSPLPLSVVSIQNAQVQAFTSVRDGDRELGAFSSVSFGGEAMLNRSDTAVCDNGAGLAFVVGGFKASSLRTNDVSLFRTDGTISARTTVNSVLANRTGSACTSLGDGRLYVFGGQNGTGLLGTTNGAAATVPTDLGDGMTFAAVTGSPGARRGTRLVRSAGRGRVVLFGGDTSTTTTVALRGDTWLMTDAGAFTELPISGPPPRTSHGMVYDDTVSPGRVVVAGGVSATQTLRDVWVLPDDVDVWQQLPITLPVGGGVGLVVDPVVGELLFVDGDGTAYRLDDDAHPRASLPAARVTFDLSDIVSGGPLLQRLTFLNAAGSIAATVDDAHQDDLAVFGYDALRDDHWHRRAGVGERFALEGDAVLGHLDIGITGDVHLVFLVRAATPALDRAIPVVSAATVDVGYRLPPELVD
jgi:hypothetical protein